MKNYPFNFEQLNKFSNELPYTTLTSNEMVLLEKMESEKLRLNFPAIENNIGTFINFMMGSWKPKTIFEMGSGYGHSAFWYLKGSQSIEKIILTEKRTDLKDVFHSLPWPQDWKDKIEYFQGDAFQKINDVSKVDLCLIDGVKADYLKFLNCVQSKMSVGGIVLIDNSYWRGSFLDPELSQEKKSAKNIKELHEFLRNTNDWDCIFIPYLDGLSILRRK